MERVQEHFRPEFINRIDDIIVFHPLGEEQIRAIVDIQLAGLRKRLAERDMTLDAHDAARDQLGEAGFDPVYGARPLKRAIQQQIENPLAERILRGQFAPGDTLRGRAGRSAGLREEGALRHNRPHAVLRIPVPGVWRTDRSSAEDHRRAAEEVSRMR